MLLRLAQADDANRVFSRPLRENYHMELGIDQSDGNEAHLAVIETVILALKCCVPIETRRGLKRNAMLGPIDGVLGWIKL